MSEPCGCGRGLGGAGGESEEHGIGNGVRTAGQVVDDGWRTCRLALLLFVLGAEERIVDSHLTRVLLVVESRDEAGTCLIPGYCRVVVEMERSKREAAQ